MINIGANQSWLVFWKWGWNSPFLKMWLPTLTNQEGKTKWTGELFNRQSVVSVTNDNFSWRSHETKKHALAFFVFNERLVVRA